MYSKIGVERHPVFPFCLRTDMIKQPSASVNPVTQNGFNKFEAKEFEVVEAKRTPLGEKGKAILNIKENLEIVTLSFLSKGLIIKFASASENPTNH